MPAFGTSTPLRDDTIQKLYVKANELMLTKYSSGGATSIWGTTVPRGTDTIQVLLVKLNENIRALHN